MTIERDNNEDEAVDLPADVVAEASPLPDLEKVDGLEIDDIDDLLVHGRLGELRRRLARDARTRREAEASSATLRMG
jgi:hypothetical protein